MAYIKNAFTAWSFSRRADWEDCPFFAKLKHLDKLPVPGSPAMDRGAKIGELCEKWVNGSIFDEDFPEELEYFGPEFMELREAYLKGRKNGAETVWIEEMWGFDAEWRPVGWRDWDRCRVRIKCDLVRQIRPEHLLIVDYKTGKCRDDNIQSYMDQLHLYGTGGFSRFPDVDRIDVRLAYLDYGITYPPDDGVVTFMRKDAVAMQKSETARAAPMLADRIFKPRPGNACRWCHFKKNNGGPCQY